MASYISKYTGKQIDGAVELFEGKGLSDVIGIVQRDSQGNFSTKTISWVEDVTVDGVSVVSNKIAAINLSSKQDILVSGTNIKTINNQSILGSGNIEIGGGGVSVQSNWTETDTSSAAYILNKPNLSTVATSGNYNDLTNKPTLSTVATTGVYNDLSGKPTLSAVATTGSYNDLTDKPTIPPQLTAGTGITIDSNNVISVNLVDADTQSF